MDIYMIAPASAGSKGDEALIRGALNVYSGSNVTILTQSSPQLSWSSELLDISGSFFEKIVPHYDLTRGIDYPVHLVVIGADVLDGSNGAEPSFYRLEAIRKVLELGGTVQVFMSFRHNVDKKIVSMIKEVNCDRVQWFCRDSVSINNFQEQCCIEANYFPDFAYYSNGHETDRVIEINDYLDGIRKKGMKVVGVNYSSHSFMSLYPLFDKEKMYEYTSSVVRTIREVIKDVFIVFITHDTRLIETKMADQMFAEYAAATSGNDCYCLSKTLYYGELLKIIPHMDYVVTGRMHLAVTSIRSGVIPIMFTGDGSVTGYSIIDKCKGMFNDRIGSLQLIASNETQLIQALQYAEKNRQQLLRTLSERNDINTNKEKELARNLRVNLGLDKNSVPHHYDKIEAIRESLRLYAEIVDSEVSRLNSQHWELNQKVGDEVSRLNSQHWELNQKVGDEVSRIMEELSVLSSKIDLLSDKVAAVTENTINMKWKRMWRKIRRK